MLWITDNYSTIRDEIEKSNKEISLLTWRLPIVSEGDMRGFPRIYTAAMEFIYKTRGNCSSEDFISFFSAYAKQSTISLNELWALEAMVRLVLLREIITVSVRFSQMLTENKRGLLNITDDEGFAIETGCACSVRSAVILLKALGDIDWDELFYKANKIHSMLAEEKSGVYLASDEKTKKHWWEIIQKNAQRQNISEEKYAKALVERANDAYDNGGNGKNTCVGFYLKHSWKCEKAVFVISFFVFVITILVLTAALLNVKGATVWEYITTLFITAVLAITLSLKWAEGLCVRVSGGKKRIIPCLDKAAVNSGDITTAVAVTALITSSEYAEKMVRRLEEHYLINRDSFLRFALLCDLKEAKSEVDENDNEILNVIQRGIDRLNEKYSTDYPIFYAYIRKRRYNPGSNTYTAYERKRGAVLSLTQKLCSGDCTEFSSVFPQKEGCELCAKYCIVLDADTRIRPQGARALVLSAAHPLNTPVIDKITGRVESGYTIITAPVGVNAFSACKTGFAQIFSGGGGEGVYALSPFDIWWDVFGEGSFTGKGIISCEAFSKLMEDRFEDERILSHDLIEGGYCSTGVARGVDLTDDFPSTWISYRKREHRWIRGDWQLIGFLGKYVRNSRGERVKNTLGTATKVKMLLNLVRSTVYPKLANGLIIGIVYPFLAQWVLVWFVVKNVLPVIAALTRSAITFVFKGKANVFKKEDILSVLLRYTLIMDTAIYSIDAICKAITRLFTKKRLLEWETAQQAEEKKSDYGIFKVMLSSIILGCGVAALSVIYLGSAISFISGVIFMCAPIIMYFICKSTKGYILNGNERSVLINWCRDAWGFFERECNSETSWLPPDNVQVYPKCPPCTRTSPTNIGMYFTSLVTAHSLGLVDDSSFLQRAINGLDSLDRLEKYNFHTYNWYDIKALKPILPFFISTADNGNLACSLLVLASKAEEMLKKGNLHIRQELLKIKSLSEKIALSMDFSMLYHPKKELFAIGYDTQRGTLTQGVYDLISSEARLASVFALSQGQIGYRHWSRLTRKLMLVKNKAVLLSWSGTMFEYLMPELFFKSVKGSLSDKTHRNMLKLQIKWARENKRDAWGISESAYYSFDADKRYQYKAFGTPYTAIENQKNERIVISPYSSALALTLDINKSMQNMAVLKNKISDIRKHENYKYFLEEAIDYSKSDDTPSLVQMYMAHHVGMTVTAMGNVLCKNSVSRLFMSRPEIVALAPFITEPIEGMARKRRSENSAEISYSRDGKNKVIEGILNTPYCCLLTNSSLKAMYTSDGGGYLMLGDELATAYGGVNPREAHGSFVYIRNEENKEYFSTSPAPCYKEGCTYKTKIKDGEIEYSATVDNVYARERICISPEDNVEIKEITVKNINQSKGAYSVTGYTVPCLSRYGDWCAHRVFNEIFMSVEYDEENSLFIVTKRARHKDERLRYLMYMLVCDMDGEISHTSDREAFIGRGKDTSCPNGMLDKLTNNAETVIYPCVAIRKRLDLSRGEQRLYFVTGMFYSREELDSAVQMYKSTRVCRDTFDISALREKITRDCLNISPMGVQCGRMIAARVFFPTNRAFHKGNIDAFYKLGLSGDTPLFLCEVTGAVGYGYFLKSVLEAFAYVRVNGLPLELVISVATLGDYREALIKSVRDRAEKYRGIGGITVVSSSDISNDDMSLLRCVAKITVSDATGSLLERLKNAYGEWDKPVRPVPKEKINRLKLDARPIQNISENNKYGYFNNENGEYHITQSRGEYTPLAWSNVLTDNKALGTVVTERFGGFVWYGSAQNRLTRWYNDPVEDPPTEAVYIRNNITGEFFTVQNIGYGSMDCTVKMKNNEVEAVSQTLQYDVSTRVYVKDNIKYTLVNLKNRSKKNLSLTLYYYVDIALPGSTHTMFPRDLFSRWDNTISALEITEPTGNVSVAIASSNDLKGWISKKSDFFGRGYTREAPLALVNGNLFTDDNMHVADCGVVAAKVRIPEDNTVEVCFAITAIEQNDEKEKHRMLKTFSDVVKNYLPVNADDKLTVKIETPSKNLDTLFNHRLMKQIYGIRYIARTSYYQCSGAYGFRDQLQDMLAIMYMHPQVAREHILLCSSRQFEEGDVLHWFNEDHKSDGKNIRERLPLSGVRTKISDDKLFLPFVAVKYALFADDKDIFDSVTPYLKAPVLLDNEVSKFMSEFEYGGEGSLYDHCIRAFRNAYVLGAHGLLLMGSGDWNDAMDAIGEDGKGESVWLSMFYVYIARQFVKLFPSTKEAEELLKNVSALSQSIIKNGWDGNWYIRAFFGDKTPVGSHTQDECKIDLLAQAWAVIGDIGSKERQKISMEMVWRHLYDRENRILKLFTLPFKGSKNYPGYIQGYIPGTRENGGQYTHGAIWYAIACFIMGDKNKGWEILRMINPIERTTTSLDTEKYKTEPYWLAADIYSASGIEGRGGWSGYTGSASWYFIAITEYLLGIKIEEGKMRISPSLPDDWRGYSACIKYFDAKYHITLRRAEKIALYVDGVDYSDTMQISVNKSGEHIIEYLYNA